MKDKVMCPMSRVMCYVSYVKGEGGLQVQIQSISFLVMRGWKGGSKKLKGELLLSERIVFGERIFVVKGFDSGGKFRLCTKKGTLGRATKKITLRKREKN